MLQAHSEGVHGLEYLPIVNILTSESLKTFTDDSLGFIQQT